jgi:hypothetical protein
MTVQPNDARGAQEAPELGEQHTRSALLHVVAAWQAPPVTPRVHAPHRERVVEPAHCALPLTPTATGRLRTARRKVR